MSSTNRKPVCDFLLVINECLAVKIYKKKHLSLHACMCIQQRLVIAFLSSLYICIYIYMCMFFLVPLKA